MISYACTGRDADIEISKLLNDLCRIMVRLEHYRNRADAFSCMVQDTLPWIIPTKRLDQFEVKTTNFCLSPFDIWRGLMETEAGPSVPELFPSQPGMVFPLYHVFADLTGWRGADIIYCRSSDPLPVEESGPTTR